MLYFWLKIVFICFVALLIFEVFFLFKKKRQSNRLVKKEPILGKDFSLRVGSESTRDDSSSSENYSEQQFTVGTDDIITLTIMTRNGEYYSGYELLQALLSLGFRYGDMNIFHRHENLDGTGPILFSLAQAVAPGTFDLNDVGAISCPGLILFMEMNNKVVENLLKTLDSMLLTAKQIVDELGGDLYDEERQLLDSTSVERWRKKIMQE
jgi:cell division protein ZipA